MMRRADWKLKDNNTEEKLAFLTNVEKEKDGDDDEGSSGVKKTIDIN